MCVIKWNVIKYNPLSQVMRNIHQKPSPLFCYSALLNYRLFFALICSGDGRWRQVIRRCASVADTGVTGVCNWGVRLNGIYWEECYCSEDECNSANSTSVSCLFVIGVSLSVLSRFWAS